MENFTGFDILAAAILVLSCALSYVRGVVREAVSISVWVASALASYLGAPLAVPFMSDLPFVGNFLSTSCELSVVAAFAVMFVISLIILSPLAAMLVRLVKFPGIGVLDRSAGILFGAFRGAVIIAAALLLFDAVLPKGGQMDSVSQSQSAILFADLKTLIGDSVRDGVPHWANDLYGNVMAVCDGGAQPAEITEEPPSEQI